MIGKGPLYVSRKVEEESALLLIEWAKKAGLPTAQGPDELHLTVAYSTAPVDFGELKADENSLIISFDGVDYLGEDNDVLVLRVQDYEYLHGRWRYYRNKGASWDYPSYKPHVTITTQPPKVLKIEPPEFRIVLGPEIIEPLDLGHQSDDMEIELTKESFLRRSLNENQPPVRMRRAPMRRNYFDEPPIPTEADTAAPEQQGNQTRAKVIPQTSTTFDAGDRAYAEIRARYPEVYAYITVEAPVPIDPVQTLAMLRRGIPPREFLSHFRAMLRQDTAQMYGPDHPQAKAQLEQAFRTLALLI